jgi:transcriptional regulator with XRE-family HTH domain
MTQAVLAERLKFDQSYVSKVESGGRDIRDVDALRFTSELLEQALRPQDLLALRCNDIHERAILVRRKNVDGKLYDYTRRAPIDE